MENFNTNFMDMLSEEQLHKIEEAIKEQIKKRQKSEKHQAVISAVNEVENILQNLFDETGSNLYCRCLGEEDELCPVLDIKVDDDGDIILIYDIPSL